MSDTNITEDHRRRPAANLRIPPQCRDMIRRGTLMAINSSGGKDSQATTS